MCCVFDSRRAVNLNIDGTKSDQNVRGQVNSLTLPYAIHPAALFIHSSLIQAVLPHSLGSNLRVLVFARGAAADAARAGNHLFVATLQHIVLTVPSQPAPTSWDPKTSSPKYK